MRHSSPRPAVRLRPSLALAAGLLGGVLACGGDTGPQGPAGQDGRPPGPVRLLDDKVGRWLPENRARLNELLTTRGTASATFDPKNRPVAVFDWDNTVVKNDMGDATLFWMLRHDKVRQPADGDWGNTSTHLTAEARTALNTVCTGIAEPGAPLPTSTQPACADEIVSIYNRNQTRADKAAWDKPITQTLNTAYAWAAQLQAGYTPEELRGFARAAYAENAFNPLGTTQTVGTTSGLAFHVRVYDEMVDLIETMQVNGFDVWILTASPQFVVDAISEELVGVKPQRVVGIRTVADANGRLTARLRGCGTVADGADTLITYDQGKRCWINKAIFHLPTERQQARAGEENQRQVFAAGDSDTDLSFLQDATLLKLAINRNRVQLMCNAYANAQGRWLVQPMFIQPRTQQTSPYPCTSALDAVGQPITDEAGNPFTQDFEDRVFTLP